MPKIFDIKLIFYDFWQQIKFLCTQEAKSLNGKRIRQECTTSSITDSFLLKNTLLRKIILYENTPYHIVVSIIKSLPYGSFIRIVDLVAYNCSKST